MIFEIVMAVASAASSIAQGIGQQRAADAARKEGNRLADDAIQRGEEEARRYSLELAQVVGRQRSMQAARGLDLEFGSAKAIRDETQAFGMEDLATIRLNAAREARGLRSQYNQFANQQSAAAKFSFLNAGIDAFTVWNRSRGLIVPNGPRRPSESSLAGQITQPGSTFVPRPAGRPVSLPGAGR